MAETTDVDRLEGCMLGLMTGDCLGLPLEALSPRRARRLFGPRVRHRFLFGRGMASDDTELGCMAAQSLLISNGDPERFQHSLAWGLRLWLLTLPAGIGLATLTSTLRLWLGWPAGSSGARSAGNGPLLRAPVLGSAFRGGKKELLALVDASTRVTHTDPRALRAARATALAARYARESNPDSFSAQELLNVITTCAEEDAEFLRWLELVRASRPDDSPKAFLRELGCTDGISGYAYHTLPAVLWSWLKDPLDFRAGMERVLSLGGDADTTAAVYGALCGSATGAGVIPREWLEPIVEFPRTTEWVRALAQALAGRASPPPLAWPLYALRTPIYWAAIIGHGLRRLAPPY